MSTLDASSVAKEIVDDLFPVAQGIHESAPMSFCLRYAIEYSRLRMLKSVRNLATRLGMQPLTVGSGNTNWGGIEDQIRQQRSVLDSWKGRCESQLNMLAVCKSNGVFDMIPGTEFAYDCPFTITTKYNTGTYYVTPGSCLLYYAGEFFNPCRHSTKQCNSKTAAGKPAFSVDEITGPQQRANTLVAFDVRSVGSGEILGVWPTKFYDKNESRNEVAVQVVERLLLWQASSSSTTTGQEGADFEALNYAVEGVSDRGANVPWRLSKEFIEHVFMDGGSSPLATGSVGNTKAGRKGWGKAEGLVTSASGDVAEFCDGIADWWPDVSFQFQLFFLHANGVDSATRCAGLDQACGVPCHGALQQGPGRA